MRLCHRIIQILLDSRINLVFIFIIINVYNKNIKQQIFCNRPTICSFTKIRMTSGRQQRCPFFLSYNLCLAVVMCRCVCVSAVILRSFFCTLFSHSVILFFLFFLLLLLFVMVSSSYSLLCLLSSTSFTLLLTFVPVFFFLFPFYNIYYTM